MDRTTGDVGSAHICVEVDDIAAAYNDLTARARSLPCAAITLTDGAFAGPVSQGPAP